MTKKLIILVGPKGSGKSHIGRELEKQFGIKYVRVESVWQDLKNTRNDFLSPDYIREGRQRTLDLIQSSFHDCAVCIEASGVSEDWDEYVSALKKLAEIVFIKIECSLDECRSRALGRDQSLQVQIPDDLFEEINVKASKVSLKWDIIVKNDPFISSNDLYGIMGPVLIKHGLLKAEPKFPDPKFK